MLDEVVVVGYGTMKKKDLTGAVAAVKGDDLAARKRLNCLRPYKVLLLVSL